MFKNLTKYVVIVMILAVITVTFFLTLTNDNILDEFNREIVNTRIKFIDQYIEASFHSMDEVIISNAQWTNGRLRFLEQDTEWLKENMMTYIVEDLGYLHVSLVSDDESYHIEEGELPFDVRDYQIFEDIIRDRASKRAILNIEDEWYLINGGPMTDEEVTKPTGAYIIVNSLDDMLSELQDLLKVDDETEVYFSHDKVETDDIISMDYQLPYYQGDQKIFINLNVSNLKSIISSQRDYSIVIVLFVTFFIFIALVYAFHRGDEKMTIITNEVKLITSGDYSIRIPVEKHPLLPELELLADSINHMSDEVEKHIDEIDKRYAEMVNVLVDVVEMKDQYTYHHSVAVADYALMIGRAIEFKDLINLELAAKLHDVGKISISTEILNKPGRLTDEEFEIIKEHSRKGYELLSGIDYFKDAREAILYHHERIDGTGYPFGLAGDEIPIMAQIITIADAFDAMTSDRAYRKALSVEQAIRNLEKDSGTMFNDALVSVFVEAFRKRYIKNSDD